ncbi:MULTISPECIES: NADPH-dependent FMN reductase [Paenibacillus]|uniref:FMN reductase n=1 Tax=Paenibacillus barengoltzii G22 TaxID=1235795 RepID=R9L8Q3_9BACL|nr:MULTISPECIES: NADPH-dependent FMN reductase [Paenibacillus]EOS54943.1 FMN reductase [Paenibacillus barengoltzii G22]MDU0328715.1 NADPH-dependent FMN reductase [Paenibacillus sp. 3LSP]
MSNIVILAGSPTLGSRLFGLTDYVQEKLTDAGHSIDWFSAAELPAEDLLRANFNSEVVKDLNASVEAADAVIIASPVYKASYSGALKTILDLIPQKGLQGKLVLPLFIGGTIAHLLAVDYALKPVVAALGGTHILGGVFAVDQWVSRLENGGFALEEQLRERLDEAVTQLNLELARYRLVTEEQKQGQVV